MAFTKAGKQWGKRRPLEIQTRKTMKTEIMNEKIWKETAGVSVVVADSLWPHRLQLSSLLCPRDFPGKTTGVGCHSLLQRVFLTQGSNPGFLHCRRILYHLSYSARMISVSQRKKKGKERTNQKEVNDPHLWQRGVPTQPSPPEARSGRDGGWVYRAIYSWLRGSGEQLPFRVLSHRWPYLDQRVGSAVNTPPAEMSRTVF